MARYIGKRIVPKHCGYWDNTKAYEMENIVYNKADGNSYISRKAVPAGTDISQGDYWALCSDFNEQMDLLSHQMADTEAAIKADNDATEAAIKADNKSTADTIKADNDETESAIKADNKSTSDHVDKVVGDALSAMTKQKASFDSTASALNTRMDAVLAAGTGAGDTEIIDARVDKSGVAHDSLGAAVRHVEEEVDGLYVQLDNLYRMSTAQKGYVSSTTGSVGGWSKTRNEMTSDFIPLGDFKKLTVQVWATPVEGDKPWQCVGYYDEDKNFIRRNAKDGTEGESYDVFTYVPPENAAYARVSARLYQDGKVCVNYGSIPITYRKAWDDVDDNEAVTAAEITSNHNDLIGGYYMGEWDAKEEDGTLTVTMPEDCKIRVGRLFYDVSKQVVSFEDVGSKYMYALFITDDGELRLKYYRDVLTPDEHLVGYIYRTSGMLQTPLVNMASLITSSSPCGLILGAYSPYYVQFDTENKTITFPPDTLIVNSNTRYGNAYFFCPRTCDYSELETSAIKIYYSILKQELIPRWYSAKPAKDDILICSFRTSGSRLTVSMNAPYFVDGKPLGLDLNKYIDFPETPKMPTPFSFIRAVNHRGWNWYAPENTIPAFIQSKKNGFDAVECDVHWTSDGVPVILHDDTINRTARNEDGTALEEDVNIKDITFEEARMYDFGIRNGEKYKGTQIPTFDEFMKICKQLGMHPYIEIKSGCTPERAQGLVDIVKRYRLLRDCTWISFAGSFLGYIRDIDPQARLGLLASSVSESMINTAKGLQNDENEVFVECAASNVTEESVTMAREADLGYEVWGANTDQTILNLDPYISGMTSDGYVAGQVLYDLLAK